MKSARSRAEAMSKHLLACGFHGFQQKVKPFARYLPKLQTFVCQARVRTELEISAHADGGPRFRVCARETLRSALHRHERKFSGARVCRVTFKHSNIVVMAYPNFDPPTWA
jgi:hypothetical protein